MRAVTAAVLALAMTLGGGAMAQQTSVGESPPGGTADQVGAPASGETGVKGVYSTKRMMGISTGQAPAEGSEGAGSKEASAGAKKQAGSESN